MNKTIHPILKPYRNVFLKPLILLSGLSFLLSTTAIIFAYFSKLAIDHYDDLTLLFIYGGVLVFVMASQLVLSAFNQYYKAKSTYHLETTMRQDLYMKLLKSKLKTSGKEHSAVYMNHFKTDLTMITDGTFDLLPKVTFYVFRFLGAFIVLFVLDAIFAVLFVTLGIALFLVSRLLSRKIKQVHKTALVAEDSLYLNLQEGLTHLEVIKAFEAEETEGTAIKAAGLDYYQKRLNKQALAAWTGLGLHGFFAFGYVFAILFGAYRLNQGTLVIGSLVAIIQLVQNIQSPFSGLSSLVVKYNQWRASLERVETLLKVDSESASRMPVYPFKKIEIKNVSFQYEQALVLEKISFDIKPGEIIWLKGESGKGKTTLIKLLLGLFPPTSGSITLKLDEVSYEISESTRSYFSYVPQGQFLMSNTILENLTLGKDIPMDKIIQACQTSMIYHDILETEKGFQTPLRELGAGLSLGQLSRLSLARALLKEAPILLLDEMTASLDSETEKKVLLNLKALKQKTIVFISHRDLKDIKPNRIIEI